MKVYHCYNSSVMDLFSAQTKIKLFVLYIKGWHGMEYCVSGNMLELPKNDKVIKCMVKMVIADTIFLGIKIMLLKPILLILRLRI